MINELIILADELDKCGEKQAANAIDNIIKTAREEEGAEEEFDLPLTPLIPEADLEEEEELAGAPTKVDFFSATGPQLVARLRKFLTDHPEPAKWTEEDRAKFTEAADILRT